MPPEDGRLADGTTVDVVVVGGGPAGCSAAVFTARYGLETVVFDRGNAALARAAFLDNYPGFPGGIDVDTYTDLIHDHAESAGCTIRDDTVVAVEHARDERTGSDADDAPRFQVETQDGRSLLADDVVAAAWYDGSYMRPLVGDVAFERHEHHGEERERFDPDYPDADGRTPVEGLYVASPLDHRNAQAIVSAGQGAHVARSLVEDRRLAEGFPEGVLAAHYDWLRPESEFEGEWGDRERWRTWFGNKTPEGYDPDGVAVEQLRERYIDRAFETRLSADEIERRRVRGHRRLLEHLDDDLVLARAEEIRRERSAAAQSSGPVDNPTE